MINEPITLPRIELIAPNVMKLFLPNLTMMYSYEECVGFKGRDGKYYYSAEFHSKTSSKHLSQYFGSEKKERVSPELFAETLEIELNSVYK
jgi:hypothetical protein